ncbi:MAG: hypothetical protein Kow00129_06020 [Thermoleophilia bacterium]
MNDVHGRIDESKNWFEKAAENIPGYRGYKQKELRREADRLQRDYVAERLELARRRIEELELALSRMGDLDLLGFVDTTARKLRTVKDRFAYADYGYAGLFDAVKVDEQILDRLYEFDADLQAEARGVEELVDTLRADSPSLRSDIALLDERIEALDEYFAQREHIITGVGR